MNEQDVEARLRKAVAHAVPDVLDDILSECDNGKGKIINMNTKKTNSRKWLRYACSAAAALMLVTGGSFAYGAYQETKTVDSIVSLDVNPSVELLSNKFDKVIAANSLNSDGAEILEGLKLKGVDLDTALRAVIGSMVEKGYLSELQNSILLTVAGGDAQKNAELEERLTHTIDGILSDKEVTGAILAQTDLDDADIKQISEALAISSGKAALIKSLVDENDDYTLEELAKLTINELNLLLEKEVTPEGISVTGSASDKNYIGGDKAANAALAHAGITADGKFYAGVELDYEGGRMVYEVEFCADGKDYEYDVDAISGEIVKALSKLSAAVPAPDADDKDDEWKNLLTDAVQSAVKIGEEKARETAAAHAGVILPPTGDINVELDEDGSTPKYEVEFDVDGTEYSYDIDAITGAILDHFSKLDKH
ncbi:MAG: PepSY domain-containing protein [Oscillospiraceae bacterium]